MSALTAGLLLVAMGVGQNAATSAAAPAAKKPAPANQNAPDLLAPEGDQQGAANQADGNEVHVHHHHHHYFHSGGDQASPYIPMAPPSDPSLTPYPRVGGYGGGYGGYGGGWGGWGGYTGTIAGSYLQGLGAAASGAGQYNLATSEAARQIEAARAAYLQNQMTALNDYFMAREANRQFREDMRTPRLTPEQLYQVNLSRLPKRLRLDQFDPVTGKINWPDVLKLNELDAERKKLDELFASRTHDNSGVGSENYHEVQMTTHDMLAKLHDDIKVLSPSEYLAGVNFLDSLAFEARFPPSSVPGVTSPSATPTPPNANLSQRPDGQ